MRTLVIESTPTALRWTIESKSGTPMSYHKSHRLVGLNNSASDSWIWTEGDERITAFGDLRITVYDLWNNLLEQDETKDRHKDASLLINSFQAAISIGLPVDRVVMLIPESLPENSQNSLVTELGSCFGVSQSDTYLLWRSVALSLCPETKAPKDKTRRLICDFGHSKAEATLLTTAYSKDCYCPIRDFTKAKGSGPFFYTSLKNWLQSNYKSPIPVQSVWDDGFAVNAASNLEDDKNFDIPGCWTPEGLSFKPIKYDRDDWAKPADLLETTHEIGKFIEQCDLSENEEILWHGWPIYWHGEDTVEKLSPASHLLQPDHALKGGAEFARRHRLRLPTYFELLPGYEVWCQAGQLGLPRKWGWETLIKGRRIDGTATAKAPPNNDFSLLAGTKQFPLSVRVSGQDKYRYIDTELPVTIDDNEPIIIRSEIRPTGGSVKITISPKNRPDLFGKKAEVALRWDRAEERSVEEIEKQVGKERYKYPFIIQSEGDAWKRHDMNHIVSVVASGSDISAMHEIHDLIKQSYSQIEEAYTDAFGNFPIENGLSDQWEQFVAELNDYAVENLSRPDHQVGRKWVGTAGRLFHYASEDFRDAVFKRAFAEPFTPGGSTVPAMCRWALGRTCRNPNHLEAYVKKGLHEWGNMRGMEFWLFWPFCKSLSYYGDSAKISRESALGVFECGSEMLSGFIEGTVAANGTLRQNWLKWTLSALLFGLRVREITPDFLPLKATPDDGLERERKVTRRLRRLLKDEAIYYERIPPASLAGITIPQGEVPTLPELVLRFLEERADDTDVAIAGGIGLTS